MMLRYHFSEDDMKLRNIMVTLMAIALIATVADAQSRAGYRVPGWESVGPVP